MSHPHTSSIITTMQSNNYFPHIYRPTRFPRINATAAPSLLNHIWVNLNEPVLSGILHFCLNDHLPVFMNYPAPSKMCNKILKICFRKLNWTNRLQFTRTLPNTYWNLYFTNRITLTYSLVSYSAYTTPASQK